MHTGRATCSARSGTRTTACRSIDRGLPAHWSPVDRALRIKRRRRCDIRDRELEGQKIGSQIDS
eukprot:341921-Alexandrium_andersonii.AAC.1